MYISNWSIKAKLYQIRPQTPKLLRTTVQKPKIFNLQWWEAGTNWLIHSKIVVGTILCTVQLAEHHSCPNLVIRYPPGPPDVRLRHHTHTLGGKRGPDGLRQSAITCPKLSLYNAWFLQQDDAKQVTPLWFGMSMNLTQRGHALTWAGTFSSRMNEKGRPNADARLTWSILFFFLLDPKNRGVPCGSFFFKWNDKWVIFVVYKWHCIKS